MKLLLFERAGQSSPFTNTIPSGESCRSTIAAEESRSFLAGWRFWWRDARTKLKMFMTVGGYRGRPLDLMVLQGGHGGPPLQLITHRHLTLERDRFLIVRINCYRAESVFPCFSLIATFQKDASQENVSVD